MKKKLSSRSQRRKSADMKKENERNLSVKDIQEQSRIKKYANDVKKTPYMDFVFQRSPKSTHWKNMFWAFVVGGLICAVGQVIIELFVQNGVEEKQASVYASCILVALAACATGLGIYDNLGRFAGAGSTIPITGFSNAVVAPAIEFRSEGMIYGLAAKMFTVAGPVLVNGIFVSSFIAVVYLIFGV